MLKSTPNHKRCLDTLVEQMKEKENITEQLKAENKMEWVGKMNSIKQRANEIVNAELIYKSINRIYLKI